MEGGPLLSSRRGPELVGVTVVDAASAWRRLGFSLDGGAVRIGPLAVWTGQPGDAPGWAFDSPAITGTLDGVPVPPIGGRQPPEINHANGVIGVDHAVVLTPDVRRTSTVLEAAGFPLRRVRELDEGRKEQRFFWAGSTVLEVAGPVDPAGDGPARLWGLALVSADLDRTAHYLGERISPPRPAVQPRRRIATIATADAGITLALAVMSPH